MEQRLEARRRLVAGCRASWPCDASRNVCCKIPFGRDRKKASGLIIPTGSTVNPEDDPPTPIGCCCCETVDFICDELVMDVDVVVAGASEDVKKDAPVEVVVGVAIVIVGEESVGGAAEAAAAAAAAAAQSGKKSINPGAPVGGPVGAALLLDRVGVVGVE